MIFHQIHKTMVFNRAKKTLGKRTVATTVWRVRRWHKYKEYEKYFLFKHQAIKEYEKQVNKTFQIVLNDWIMKIKSKFGDYDENISEYALMQREMYLEHYESLFKGWESFDLTRKETTINEGTIRDSYPWKMKASIKKITVLAKVPTRMPKKRAIAPVDVVAQSEQ